MVIILKPENSAAEILDKISQFLEERGMNINGKKTRLTASTDGFDFLGWHFVVQSNGKFRCIPSVDNFKAFRQKVKRIVKNSNYGATDKALKLAPVVEVGEITTATARWMGHACRCTTCNTERSRCSIKKPHRTASLPRN